MYCNAAYFVECLDLKPHCARKIRCVNEIMFFIINIIMCYFSIILEIDESKEKVSHNHIKEFN